MSFAFRAVRTAMAMVLAAVCAVITPPQARAVTAIGYSGLTEVDRAVPAVVVSRDMLVNTRTGNLKVEELLLLVPGRGLPVEVGVVHNSDRREVSSPVGNGWSLSYDMRYVDDVDGDIRIIRGDGHVDRFDYNGGVYTAPPGISSTLTRLAPDVLELHNLHGIAFRFGDPAHRKLTSIADPNGNQLVLDYDELFRLEAIVGSSGPVCEIDWGSDGRIDRIVDPGLGRSYTFRRDGAGRLTGIEDPLGRATTFAYDPNGLLVGRTDRRGSETEITYGSAPGGGWRVDTVFTAGSAFAFAWDLGAGTTTVTDPNGNDTVYTFSGSGLIGSITDPLGFSRSFVWSADRTLLEHTDQRGAVSTFDYDVRGNLLKATLQIAGSLTAVTEYTYDDCNLPKTIRDPRNNVWTLTRDDACNLVRIDDPPAAGTSETRVVDAFGQTTSRTDRTGRLTTFGYDTRGNVVSVTDGLGNTDEFVFDLGGRLTAAEDPLGHRRTFEYDALGNLLRTVLPSGNDLTFTYDGEGNRLSFTDAEGNVTMHGFDAAGRRVSTTNALGDSDHREYDANGNLVEYIDRRGSHWMRSYDARNRLVGTLDPTGRTTASTYDGTGNLLTHTDGKGQVTGYQYDFLGRLVQRDSADSSRTTFTYDAGSNLLSAVDRVTPGGTVTSNLTFVYDVFNNVTRFNDVLLNCNIRRMFDAEGRQISEIDAVGNPTTFQYDQAGRLSGLSSFLGTATYGYDAAGRRTLDARSNGAGAAYTYDDDDNLTSVVIDGPGPGIIAGITYTRDANGAIVAALQNTGENVAFSRDALGRIATEQGTLGGAYLQQLTFDANGNRLTSTFDRGSFHRVISETFDAANNAVAFSNLVNGTGPTATHSLDGNGSRIQTQFSGGGITTSTFNARNLLTGIDQGGGNAATFTWDALDRLHGRGTPSGSTRFVYGPDVVTGVANGIPFFNVIDLPGEGAGNAVFPNGPTLRQPPRRLGPGRGGRAASVILDRVRRIRPPGGRMVGFDLQGTSSNVFHMNNFEGDRDPFGGLLVTGAGGSLTGRQDPTSDPFNFRLNTGSIFQFIPQAAYPAGSAVFPSDSLTVDPVTQRPYDYATGSALAGTPGDAGINNENVLWGDYFPAEPRNAFQAGAYPEATPTPGPASGGGTYYFFNTGAPTYLPQVDLNPTRFWVFHGGLTDVRFHIVIDGGDGGHVAADPGPTPTPVFTRDRWGELRPAGRRGASGDEGVDAGGFRGLDGAGSVGGGAGGGVRLAALTLGVAAVLLIVPQRRRRRGGAGRGRTGR